MLSRGVGALSGLRWGILSVATVVSILAVSSETSDARSRRKHVEPSETSNSNSSSNSNSEAVSDEPRYSDIVVDGNTGAILHASNPDALRHPASALNPLNLR